MQNIDMSAQNNDRVSTNVCTGILPIIFDNNKTDIVPIIP